MDMIEIRLSGPKATLSHICRAIDRQLTQGPLERVELRYSTQASKPLGHQQAKQAIADLLRENGMNGTAVSVRAHEAPLDVASGDHVVRLFPRKDRPSATQPQSVRTGVAAWLERWFPKWFKPKPVEPHGAGSEPAQPPGHAAISSQQAVLLLRQAVGNAAHYRQTGSKTLVVGDAEEFAPVVWAAVVVRNPMLHQVLSPLLPPGSKHTAESIAGFLGDHKVKVAADFLVKYEYRRPGIDTGTTLAGEADLEVLLMQTRPEPKLDHGDVRQACVVTAMPVRSTRSTAAQSDFEIRVLGTWKDGATRPFATPFTLAFSRLPARFDRDALLATPMAQVHPELMSVASNSRPLMVDQDGLGGILLQTPGAASMYRTIDGLECLRASEPLTQRTAVLVVNDPNGVARTGQTEVLPALVIQMCSGLAN